MAYIYNGIKNEIIVEKHLQTLNEIAKEINISKFYYIRMDSEGITLLSDMDNRFMSDICHRGECVVKKEDGFVEIQIKKYPYTKFKFNA